MFAMPGLRAFSLSAERASNAVSCGATGVFVGDVPLLQAAGGAGANRQWSVRPISELNEEAVGAIRLAEELQEILNHFLETGEPSKAFSWEDFDPEAVREAAGGHLQWQMPGKSP
jgi:hypothetical protein